MRARLSSRRFVGRAGELAALELAVREASRGLPRLVLIGGDSGVGKSRLVAELEHRLTTADPAPLVLHGDTVQPVDGELPYAPLLGALRPLIRAEDPVFGELHHSTREQLTALLPELTGVEAVAAASAGDSVGQLRLREAVLVLLAALAERAPLVLVLEDLHWADGSTRALLTYLARGLRDERVLLLGTYRADELSRRHPLRPLIAELERLGGTRRIHLEPFDRSELSELLGDILGAAPDAALVERLFSRSEGNPLYGEELLAAGLDGRGAPPQSLSDAFLGRIESLAPETQRLVRTLAVGPDLDEPALTELTGLDTDAVRVALREAVAEQVLVVGVDGGFRFRHALLREALDDDLLPGERTGLHAAHARLLEVKPARGESAGLRRLVAIAAHYHAAGDQAAALRASVAAGDAARSGAAPAEAAELYQQALALWSHVEDPAAVADADQVAVLTRAAEGLFTAGDRTRADAFIREALTVLDPIAEAARCAHLLALHGRVLWSLNRGAQAVATGERALMLTQDGDSGGDRMQIRAWLARIQYLRGRYGRARADAEAALKTALAAGDKHAEIGLRNTLGMVQVSLGETESGLALLGQAVALARQREDPDLAAALSNLADTLLAGGRVKEALQVAQDGLSEISRSHPRDREWLNLQLSVVAFHAGDWTLAQASLSPRTRDLDKKLSLFRAMAEAELAAGIGEPDNASACLTAIAEPVANSSEPQWIGLHGALLADLATRRGDLDAARAAVTATLDQLELCTDDASRVALVSLEGIRSEADRALRARDLGETAARRDALARARLHLARIDTAAAGGRPVEEMRRLAARGELARARARPKEAARAYARASQAAAAPGLPYPEALCRRREAEALAALGDREAAADTAAAARRIAAQIGSRWLLAEIDDLAERARLVVTTTDRPANGNVATIGSDMSPGRRSPTDPFGLTDREHQVLALIARGSTNREIGATLYMAEKTASVHVSRILAKLNVRSRTEAAAVAHRLRLTVSLSGHDSRFAKGATREEARPSTTG